MLVNLTISVEAYDGLELNSEAVLDEVYDLCNGGFRSICNDDEGREVPVRVEVINMYVMRAENIEIDDANVRDQRI